ncbi:MAG: FAD-dependent oxidoreductase [Chloroflexi bacterium]|nr:FAD-dependent oxidoreductase [Chloroflexota bacterium]
MTGRRSAVGGQAGTTELIENYPGFPGSIGGAELTERMQEQALSFGVEILQAQDITEIASDGRYRTIKTASGDEYRASALLLALGTTYLRLNVPGEEDFIGAGIHFCATCDGPFYRDKDVLVIGGGNSGLQESMFLTRFAKKITILERGEQLGASQILQDKVAELPQIEVRLNSTVEEFKGDGHISGVTVKDVKSGEVEELKPDGVFVFIGLKPNTAFLNGAVELDRWGFITTDKTLQTSVPGIFAAGDVREGSTKQIASATGEGATAALMIRQYLEEQ